MTKTVDCGNQKSMYPGMAMKPKMKGAAKKMTGKKKTKKV